MATRRLNFVLVASAMLAVLLQGAELPGDDDACMLQAAVGDLAKATGALRARHGDAVMDAVAGVAESAIQEAEGTLRRERLAMGPFGKLRGGGAVAVEDNQGYVFPQALANITSLAIGPDSKWKVVMDGDESARWLSWMPWLMWEQNLTRYVMLRYTTVKQATAQLDDVERNTRAEIASRDDLATLSESLKRQVSDVELSKKELLQVVALALEQKVELCNASAAALADLAYLGDEVDQAAKHMDEWKAKTDLPALDADLAAAKANLSAAIARFQRANTSAMEDAATSESMSLELQEAIRRLNARYESLRHAAATDPGEIVSKTVVADDGTTYHTSAFKTTVHEEETSSVHDQARIVAQLTDNLTWVEIQVQKAALKRAQAEAAAAQAKAMEKDAMTTLSNAKATLQAMEAQFATLQQAKALAEAKSTGAAVDCNASGIRHQQLLDGLPSVDEQLAKLTNKSVSTETWLVKHNATVDAAMDLESKARAELEQHKAALATIASVLERVRMELGKLPGRKVRVGA